MGGGNGGCLAEVGGTWRLGECESSKVVRSAELLGRWLKRRRDNGDWGAMCGGSG